MGSPDYSATGVPVRTEMQAAHRAVWDFIATPGPCWTGAQRVAIAATARAADACPLCGERAQALSPGAVAGAHSAPGALPLSAVEAAHRIRSDPGRLSRLWYESILAGGVSEQGYVELISVVAMLSGVDFFCRSLGLELFDLPAPRPGAPTGHRPAGVKAGTAWVSMLAPEDASGPEADLYPPAPFVPNIIRALSLVPDAVRVLCLSNDAHYLPVAEIGNPMARAQYLDRMQTELVAARVSALNQCFY